MGKITFLGTAGDSMVLSKQLRSSGGIILQTGDIQLHLDPGPGALVKAVENQINLRANTAILVSNNHILNCNDVNAVIDAMTYGGQDKTGVLVANQTIINGTEEIRPLLTELHKNYLEKIITLNPGKKLGIEDVEILAIPAINSDPNAIGFKITTDEFILGYTSDTDYYKEIAEAYKGCDILILNILIPSNGKEKNNLNSEDAIKIIKKVNPKLVIMNHFGIKMLKADPLDQGRKIQKQTGIQVLVAKDGMSLNPIDYAAKSKQKRLNLFKDQNTQKVIKENKINVEKSFKFKNNSF